MTSKSFIFKIIGQKASEDSLFFSPFFSNFEFYWIAYNWTDGSYFSVPKFGILEFSVSIYFSNASLPIESLEDVTKYFGISSQTSNIFSA